MSFVLYVGWGWGGEWGGYFAKCAFSKRSEYRPINDARSCKDTKEIKTVQEKNHGTDRLHLLGNDKLHGRPTIRFRDNAVTKWSSPLRDILIQPVRRAQEILCVKSANHSRPNQAGSLK